jgi:polysaccharide export outer membrane protein
MWRSTLVFSVFAVAVVTTSACGTNINYDYSKEIDPRKGEFVIGPADVLRVTVWKNHDLSGDHTVRPDGTITIPLLGDVKATGRTASALRTELGRRLAQYVKDEAAIVTVEVMEVNSYRVTVSGEVSQRGVFSSKHYMTVVEAIMLAGGFTRFAKTDSIVVVRCCNAAGKPRRIPIDYGAIAEGRTEMNIVLLAGDEVYVP